MQVGVEEWDVKEGDRCHGWERIVHHLAEARRRGERWGERKREGRHEERSGQSKKQQS